MVLKRLMDRLPASLAAYTVATLACCHSAGSSAAMTLDQMKRLEGAAQLEFTVDKLFRSCGLPAAISDHGPASGEKQDIHWNGVAMRLSSLDWDAAYGMKQPTLGNSADWINPGKPDVRCMKELSRLLFNAKGHVGVLTVTKKTQGFGYVTSYRESKSLFKAHKVVGVTATLAQDLTVPTLVSRYGQPDEVLKQPAARDKYRYWVLTRRDHRPELLYAVDFEIDSGRCRTYAISSSSVDFVAQRLDVLLKQWERDYVLD